MEASARFVRTPEGHRKSVATGRVHVDVDAGIMQKITPGGVKVCMYIDRPGEYWTITGEAVPEAVAAKAGFAVEALKQERAFVQDQQKARAALSEAVRSQTMKKEIERGPFVLYSVGDGRAVIHKDGRPLTPDPGAFAVMQELFQDFTAALEEPIVLNLGKGEMADAGRAP